jgi:hypothetical protein
LEPVVALDTETEFSKEFSVQTRGNTAYALEAKWFLVSLYCPELEIEYAGSPENAPWQQIDGQKWVSHNAGFDEAVFYAGRARGQVPSGIAPSAWYCSSDLAVYCGLGRSLAEAVKNAFGVTVAKTIRDSAKGKTWPDSFTFEQQREFCEYCLQDSRWCYQIWQKYASDWPVEEREFANIVRTRANAGVSIDLVALKEAIVKLQEIKDRAEDEIPWA